MLRMATSVRGAKIRRIVVPVILIEVMHLDSIELHILTTEVTSPRTRTIVCEEHLAVSSTSHLLHLLLKLVDLDDVAVGVALDLLGHESPSLRCLGSGRCMDVDHGLVPRRVLHLLLD